MLFQLPKETLSGWSQVPDTKTWIESPTTFVAGACCKKRIRRIQQPKRRPCHTVSQGAWVQPIEVFLAKGWFWYGSIRIKMSRLKEMVHWKTDIHRIISNQIYIVIIFEVNNVYVPDQPKNYFEMSSAYLNNAKSWVSQPHHHLQGAFWLDKPKNHCGRSLDFGRLRKSPATCHPGKRITSSASTRISTSFTGNIPFLMWITPGLRMDSVPRWHGHRARPVRGGFSVWDLDSMQSSRTVPPPTLHDTCQNKGQKKCKKKVNCQNAYQNISHENCQSKCQNTCQNVRHRTFATTNVRQYVRADVGVALRIFAWRYVRRNVSIYYVRILGRRCVRGSVRINAGKHGRVMAEYNKSR